MMDRLASTCYGLDMASEPTRMERRILGGAVKQIRKAKDKTQQQLADKAEINFTTMSHIEAGRRQPSVAIMCRLANALGVDLDDITYMTAVYVVEKVA